MSEADLRASAVIGHGVTRHKDARLARCCQVGYPRPARPLPGGRARPGGARGGEPDPQPPFRKRRLPPAGTDNSSRLGPAATAPPGTAARRPYRGAEPSCKAGSGQAAPAPSLTRRKPRASFLLPNVTQHFPPGGTSGPAPAVTSHRAPRRAAAQAGPGPPPPGQGRGPAPSASALPRPGRQPPLTARPRGGPAHRTAAGRRRRGARATERRLRGAAGPGRAQEPRCSPGRRREARGNREGPHLAPDAPLPPLPRAAPRPAPPPARAEQPISARRRRHRQPMNGANASPPSAAGGQGTPLTRGRKPIP
ncbi:basic proline-rich protein-like [Colius striatus]|uniref:basic proline-rich protein-like n=1 Tax=Colius striatus TaxID=57412 RepID=UPI002B1E6DA6|nr:basic proline-rich protein-like [Colius striatus]